MKYKAVVWDIDNTLIDTFNQNFYPLLKIIEEELGQKMSIEDMKPYACYPGMYTLELLGIKDIPNVYARWVKYVNTCGIDASVYEGVFETLKSIPIHQAIVSSKKRAQYQIDVVSVGLDQYMDVVVLEEDTQKHKPNPEPLYLCAKRLGIDVKDILYVGDAHSDALAAKNAGCDFAYAKYGNVSNEDIEATYTLSKVEDILRYLI